MADTPAQDRKLGLPRTQIGNRWLTKYDPYVALEIVEQIAEGKLLKDICTLENHMPAKATFLRWVAREPTLQQAYAAAKEISAFSMEEEALDAARKTHRNPGTTQQLRAAEQLINQLRWSATRRDPKNYGDKGQVGITVPIQIITPLDLGDGGMKHTIEQPDIYTIDVPEEVPEQKLLPKPEPHRNGKVKLTPRIGMDDEVDYSARAEQKARKNEADRLRWREQNGFKGAVEVAVDG